MAKVKFNTDNYYYIGFGLLGLIGLYALIRSPKVKLSDPAEDDVYALKGGVPSKAYKSFKAENVLNGGYYENVIIGRSHSHKAILGYAKAKSLQSIVLGDVLAINNSTALFNYAIDLGEMLNSPDNGKNKLAMKMIAETPTMLDVSGLAYWYKIQNGTVLIEDMAKSLSGSTFKQIQKEISNKKELTFKNS